MSFAIGFVADVALARQIFHHLLQILLALSCQACVLWAALLLFLLPGRAFGGTTFLGGALLRCGLCFFSKTLGCHNRSGIACDMADETILHGSGDDGCMQLLRQFACGEFGKRSRELGFMRQSFHAPPAAELAQRLIDTQSPDQITCVWQIQNRFSDKSCGQRRAILGWSSSAGTARHNNRCSGTNAITADNNSSSLLSGPTVASRRANNSLCNNAQTSSQIVLDSLSTAWSRYRLPGVTNPTVARASFRGKHSCPFLFLPPLLVQTQ